MLPPATTPERNSELLPLAREGNEQAIDALIVGHIRYVTALAQRMCFVPQFTEDAISVAYVELCRAVRKIPEGGMDGHDNVTAYIRLWVKGRILREVKKYLEGRGENLQDSVAAVCGSDLEDREEFDSLAVTALDRRVIQLSVEGYTAQEIADRINRSLPCVTAAKNQLFDRLKEQSALIEAQRAKAHKANIKSGRHE